jgi:hypothetical protein
VYEIALKNAPLLLKLGKLATMPLSVTPSTWARLAAIDGSHDCRLTRSDMHSNLAPPPRVWFVEIWARRDHSAIINSRAPRLEDALSSALSQVERLEAGRHDAPKR